jgi:hypothetical protein
VRPAIQVATRFTVANECGLPDKAKQEYFKASEEDVVVNTHVSHRLPHAHAAQLPRPSARAFAPTARPMAICWMAMAAAAYINAYNAQIVTSTPMARTFRCPTRPACAPTCSNYNVLDLRQHHLPPQRHHAPVAGRWHIPDPERRTHLQGLPVQRGQPDPAARLRPDTMTTPTPCAHFPG